MKSILNTGAFLRIPAALALLSGTVFAGEAENIAACVDAAKIHAEMTLDEFDVVYEGAFLSFSTAKWPSVNCEVALASVWSLEVERKKLIIEGFSGENAKREYDKLEVKTEEAVALLNTRKDILYRRLAEAEQKLKAPKPNVTDIAARIEDGISKATGR